jgi:hypothetical protein
VGDTITSLFYDAFASLRLEQLVSFPTRLNNTLDIILAPKQPSDIILSHVYDAGPMTNSDHTAVIFNISFKNFALPGVKRNQLNATTFCFSRCNFDEADRLLRNIDWLTLLPNDLSTDSLLDIFMNVCTRVINATVPLLHHRSPRSHPLPKYIRRLCLAKKRAWKAYCKSNTAARKRRFNLLAAKVKTSVRHYHAVKENALVTARNKNMFFNCIKQIVSPSSNNITLIADGVMVDDPFATANILNRTFANNFSSQLLPLPAHHWDNMNIPLISDLNLTEPDVRQALLHVKPSKSSPDNLPGIFLSKLAYSLTYPIWRIFTSSLAHANIPQLWRQATVMPLYKGKGLRTDPLNYRPISLTPVLSKILEGLVKNKLVEHISLNNLADKNQHGFVAGRSVVTNLLITDSIIAKFLDQRIPVDIILFDFSKAFDRVSHSLLVRVLSDLGIRGSILAWITAFLRGRTQRVIVDGVTSDPVDVTSGVIQGSVAGPQLYSLFTTSIASCVHNAYYLLYADDLKLIQPITSDVSHKTLQADLHRLDQWATTWGMSFNKAKCHVLHLGDNNPKHTYYLGADTLTAVDALDDLGLLREAASPCQYEAHLNRTLRKAYGATFLILRGLSSRRSDIMRKIFVIYIRPIIEFAAVLWFPCTIQNSVRVERVQRLFTRFVAGFQLLSYKQRCDVLHLDTISNRVKKLKLIMLYKIVHGMTNIDLSLLNLSVTVSRTRANGIRLTLPAPRTNKMLHSFSYSSGKLWNALPAHVINAPTLSIFKQRLSHICLDDL